MPLLPPTHRSLTVNQGEGIPRPSDMITSDTPPATPREDAPTNWSSVANIGMKGNSKAQAGAIHKVDETMTPEQGLLNLRRKIAMQLKGGSHGLMRTWIIFRNRAGSTKAGITFKEFERGLRSYGLPVPDRIARIMFDRMDSSGDGHIQINEFIDHVMGRWAPESNTVAIGNRIEKKAGAMVFAAIDNTLTIEAGLALLRRKVVQRIRSEEGSLMNCWINFRERAGASKEGINASEWARGLRMYGVPLNASRAQELFNRMDASGDGYIQITEFIDQVMGRWTPAANMGVRTTNEIGQGQRKIIQAKTDIDPLLSIEAATILLRRSIVQRIKSGPNGLMACWINFRNCTGSSKEGISRAEFKKGLVMYGIPLHPSKSDALFNRMDPSGDGFIQVKEFIDHVMGRWLPSTSSIGAGTDGLGIGMSEGRRRALASVDRASKKTLVVDANSALTILRAKVSQRLPPGGGGLQRAWISFRNAGGGDHEGVPRLGLDRALRGFGLPLDKATADEIFARLDTNHDGLIHEHEFVRVVMGRKGSLSKSPSKEDVHSPFVVVVPQTRPETAPEPDLPVFSQPVKADTPRRRKQPLKRPGSGSSRVEQQQLHRPSTASGPKILQFKGKQPGAVLRQRVQAAMGKRGPRRQNMARLHSYEGAL